MELEVPAASIVFSLEASFRAGKRTHFGSGIGDEATSGENVIGNIKELLLSATLATTETFRACFLPSPVMKGGPLSAACTTRLRTSTEAVLVLVQADASAMA